MAGYVKACLNGARTPDEHPNLPVTSDELAAAAVGAHRAGAQAVHLHPKDAAARDCLRPEVVAAAVEAVRQAVPGLPVGVTTGIWAMATEGRPADAEGRLQLVRSWTTLPDFASVNWHEPGAAELAEHLRVLGVGVECGIFHADAAAAWATSATAPHCLRVMIELSADESTDAAEALLAQVRSAGSPAPILLHGLDASAWPMVELAGREGLQTRIGMEDTLALPDGSTAPDNAALVAAALALLGRRG